MFCVKKGVCKQQSDAEVDVIFFRVAVSWDKNRLPTEFIKRGVFNFSQVNNAKAVSEIIS